MYIYHLVDVITGQRLEQVYPLKAPSWTRRPEPVSWSADFNVLPAPVMSRGAPLETNPDAGLHTRIRPWRHALTVSWQQESGDEYLIAAGIIVSPLTTDETEGTVSVDTQCIREVLAGRMLMNKSHSRPTRSHVTVGPSSTLGVVSEILQRAMTPYSGQLWGDAFRLPLDLPVNRTTYEWAGDTRRSASIKKINGVEVERNWSVNGDFNTDTYGWTVIGGTAVSTTSYPSMWGLDGGSKMHVESDSSSTLSVRHDPIPVTGGGWIAGRWLIATENYADTREQVWFYDANDRLVDTAAGSYEIYPWYAGQDQQWVYPVPLRATSAEVRVYYRPESSGDRLWLDRVRFATASSRQAALDQVEVYFDGSTRDDAIIPGNWSFTWYGYNFKEVLEAIEDIEDEARLVVDFNPYWDSNFRLRWAVEVFSEAERDNVLIDIGSTGSLQPQARYLGTSEDWAEVATITHHTGKGSEADILYDRNSYVSDLVIAREQLITRPDIETQLHLRRQADADFEGAQRVFIQDEVAIALDPDNPEWWAPDQLVMGASVQLTIEESAYYGHATIQRILVGWKASGHDEIVLELQDLHATFDSVK